MKEGDQKDRFLILGFLRKTLSKDEMDTFQKRMKDESFQEKVSEESVKQYGRIELNSKLDGIHQTVVKNQDRNRIYKYIFLAVLVALIAITFWRVAINDNNTPALEPDQVFAYYFEPYASLFEQKGESTDEEEGFFAAMKAYTDQDYTAAILLFESNFSYSTSKKSLPTFYYGIALLANEQTAKAKGVLIQLKEGSSSLLPKEPLYWYLALANLVEGNENEAKPLLEWIAARKKGSFKQKEANEILKILIMR